MDTTAGPLCPKNRPWSDINGFIGEKRIETIGFVYSTEQKLAFTKPGVIPTSARAYRFAGMKASSSGNIWRWPFHGISLYV